MRRSPARCTAGELAARIWVSAQSARPCRKALPAGRAFAWLSNWVWVIPIAVLAFVFLLFPAGRRRSRRWRPAAWFVGGAFTFTGVVLLVHATGVWSDPFGSASQAGRVRGCLQEAAWVGRNHG
jgi:hypothetical protein